MGGDGTGLSVDDATLSEYTKGTRLEGRATIDPTLAGTEKLGVTDMFGRVRISPDAFGSGDILQNVVEHEDVHVGQVISGNFWSNQSPNRDWAHAVNEVEAYRTSTASLFQQYADNPGLAGYLDSQLEQLAGNLGALENSPYLPQVTTWPYNYTLAPGDQCLPTVLSPR